MAPRPVTRRALRTRLLVLGVVAVGAVLSACSNESDPGPNTDAYAEIEGEIGELPGVAEVSLTTEWIDEGMWETHAEVEMHDDASPADIAAVNDHIASEGEERLDPDGENMQRHGYLGLFVMPDGDSMSAQVGDESALGRAERFLRAHREFPAARVEAFSDFSITFEDSRAAAVTATARTLLRSPTIAGNGTPVVITALAANNTVSWELSTADLDPDLVDTWEQTLAGLEGLPADVVTEGVDLDDGVNPSQTHVEGHRTLDLRLDFPEAEPQVDRYRDRLGPVLGTLLDSTFEDGEAGELMIRGPRGILADVTTDGSDPAHLDDPAWHRFVNGLQR